MEAAGRVLAGLGDQDRDRGETRIAVAVLRLAQGDPRAALAELAPVRDGSAPLVRRSWLVIAFLLDAVALDALGDPVAAGHALESAFDAAEPDHILLPFLIYLASGLLERHARGSAKHAHAALAAEILSLLPAPAERGGRTPSRRTCVTCMPSSARTGGRRRSSGPAPLACSHPLRAHPMRVSGIRGRRQCGSDQEACAALNPAKRSSLIVAVNALALKRLRLPAVPAAGPPRAS